MNRSANRRRIPLHEQIARELRKELVAHGVPGQRFPSQNELAARFGIAPGTAREAVALLVQEGLVERRHGSGTYIAKRPTSRVIGIVSELDISHPNTSPFFLHVVQRLRSRFAAAGYLTRVYVGHATPYADSKPDRITSEEFLMDVEAGHLIGIVDIGSPAGLVASTVGKRPIPLIHSGAIAGCPFIDYLAMTRLGVKTLGERGCRRVACLDLGAPDKPSPRLARFQEETARLGLETCPEWQLAVQFLHAVGDGAQAFRRIWSARTEKPDGLLVLDDVLYADLAPLLLQEHVRVPDDLVVVSHANLRERRIPVPTPIRLAIDPDELAAAIVLNLLRRLRDPQAPVEGLPVPIHVLKPGEGGLWETSESVRSAEPRLAGVFG